MNRRHALTLVASAATLASLAQTGAMAQTAAPIGDAEMKHAAATKMVGTLSLATSRVAAAKATDDIVKQFAGWEVAEQETIGDILKSMEMSADAAQGALMPPTESETEAALDAAGKAELTKLTGETGAAFDKAYVSAQLDGHKKLLQIQEDYLKVGKVREHLSVAKLARGMVKEHIDHLEMLKTHLA